MSKHSASSVTCTLLACALIFHPRTAKADPLPTITVTSATGAAYFGGGPDGCPGVCFSFSNPNFGVGFEGFVPSPYYQAEPGQLFEPDPLLFNSGEAFGAPSNPTGGYTLNGVSYPVIFSQLQVTGESTFIVPFGGTVEIPAVLTGSGVVCNGINPIFNCSPSPGDPNPVLIADLNLDVQGYLTVNFSPPGALPGVVLYNAGFTPIPEPSTLLLLLAAIPIVACFLRRRSRATCAVFAVAVVLAPALARADPLPTITITSASGSASWGDYKDGCPGICIGLSSPIFALGFSDYVPAPYYQATPGTPFTPIFALAEVIGPPATPAGGVVVNGIDYPIAFGEVEVTAAPFTVPYGGTVEIPALLAGTGMACTAVYPPYGCYPDPTTMPYPVEVANVDLDIQGYLTFAFHQAPEISPNLEFTSTFTPIPEPQTALPVFAALSIIACIKKKRLKGSAASRFNIALTSHRAP